MIKEIKGNLLGAKEDIILHQVNLQKVMGGGIALAIAQKFPEVEEKYVDFEDAKLGDVLFVETPQYIIGNVYSQNPDFTTNYDALEKSLKNVDEYMRKNNLKSVAIPHHYGCGIAKGDWNVVLNIFDKILGKYNLMVYNIK